jgi:hypothetical protein
MESDENINNERLQRAIKCLQLIQRTNAPKASITKAATKALIPLMAEAADRPLPPSRAKPKLYPPAPSPQNGVDEGGADLFKSGGSAGGAAKFGEGSQS